MEVESTFSLSSLNDAEEDPLSIPPATADA